MKLKKDILIGIGLGIALPIVGYAIVMIMFEQLTDSGLMNEIGSSLGIIKRMRTMGVLAIAFNLIPFHYYKRKRNESAMRGILFATFMYATVWIIYFWDSIMV